MNSANIALAASLKSRLESCGARLVLAESCTAGQIAATLGCIPGVSQWLCGGFVVYRSASKTSWLGVPQDILDDPAHGPVSELASTLLAEAALRLTPEAHWSLAITGDVGPGAPSSSDGTCFVSVLLGRDLKPLQSKLRLMSVAPKDSCDVEARVKRLEEATGRALEILLQYSA